MTLGQRIQIILNERNLKQIDFAKSLGITANYANLIANGRRKDISETLARLIEEIYGYSASWVRYGIGEKYAVQGHDSSRVELLRKVKRMTDDEVRAALAFIYSLEKVNKRH